MTEKELKKLNRYQMLEIIIMQTEEIQKLKAELEETKAQLESKQINAAQAGNIAQAALALSGVFEAAQSAADLYLESIKQYAGKTEDKTCNAQSKTQNAVGETQITTVQNILEETRRMAAEKLEAEEKALKENVSSQQK